MACAALKVEMPVFIGFQAAYLYSAPSTLLPGFAMEQPSAT